MGNSGPKLSGLPGVGLLRDHCIAPCKWQWQ